MLLGEVQAYRMEDKTETTCETETVPAGPEGLTSSSKLRDGVVWHTSQRERG